MGSKQAGLTVERVLSIPLREVSGLCIHRAPGRPVRLVAVGDASSELVWANLVAGEEPRWDRADLSSLGLEPAADTGSSQFEAIATDARGVVLILREYPALVHVVEPRERSLVASVGLMMRTADGLRAPRRKAAASLGEAMLPLRDGRLLISKEKDPPLLFEFGPPGEASLGIDPGRVLGPDEAWSVPAGDRPHLESLARWPLDAGFERDFRDISDVAAGPDGRIYLLSDQSARIARLPSALPAPGEPVQAEATWRLGGNLEKAEGLELLDDGRAIVALDEKHGKRNLYVLGPPIAAPS
jgi:hypothetical protein